MKESRTQTQKKITEAKSKTLLARQEYKCTLFLGDTERGKVSNIFYYIESSLTF